MKRFNPGYFNKTYCLRNSGWTGSTSTAELDELDELDATGTTTGATSTGFASDDVAGELEELDDDTLADSELEELGTVPLTDTTAEGTTGLADDKLDAGGKPSGDFAFTTAITAGSADDAARELEELTDWL